MNRLATVTALLLGAVLTTTGAVAQDAMLEGPSAKAYLDCTRKCQKDFYFSEKSDPSFAVLRNACIEGCGFVADANMSAYQSCSVGCQETFPYRHGTNPEFAGFQKSCIDGCRRVH